MDSNSSQDKGSIELVVLGLLAALIAVLALPLITEIGGGGSEQARASSYTVPK